MRWFKVRWIHDDADYPTWLFSEVDDRLMEVRKVDVFRDGRRGRASSEFETPETDTALSEAPIAESSDVVGWINQQGEFEAFEIERAEFEREWAAVASKP